MTRSGFRGLIFSQVTSHDLQVSRPASLPEEVSVGPAVRPMDTKGSGLIWGGTKEGEKESEKKEL